MYHLLCPHYEHQNNPFQSKHFHQRNRFSWCETSSSEVKTSKSWIQCAGPQQRTSLLEEEEEEEEDDEYDDVSIGKSLPGMQIGARASNTCYRWEKRCLDQFLGPGCQGKHIVFRLLFIVAFKGFWPSNYFQKNKIIFFFWGFLKCVCWLVLKL